MPDELQTTCEVCRHDERTSIDRALGMGEQYDFIARRYGVTVPVLIHHRSRHLPKDVFIVPSAGDPQELMGDLILSLNAIRGRFRIAQEKLSKKEDKETLTELYHCMREQRAQVDLIARMMGIMGHTNTGLTDRMERTISEIIAVLKECSPETAAKVRRAIANIR